MTEQQPEAPAVPGVTRWRTPPAPPGVIREAIRLASGNLPDVAAWVRSHGQECQDDGADLLIGSPGDYIRAVPGDWVIRNPDSYWGFGHDVMPAEAFTATYEPAPGPLVLPAGEFSLVRMLAERTGLAEPSGDAPDPLPEGSAPPEGNAAKTSVSFGGETAGTPVRWDDGTYRHAACDTAIVGLRARAEAAEAKLAAIGKQCGKAAEVLRRGTGVPFSQMDVMVDARYILEIIGSEEAGHA